jgi:hypothetical protein
MKFWENPIALYSLMIWSGQKMMPPTILLLLHAFIAAGTYLAKTEGENIKTQD